MNNTAKWPVVSTRNPSQVAELAACLAILATGATIFLLVSLHALSPEFSPSWRVISEYAFGHYAWVLSLMFLSWGIGSWALVAAIWSQVHTNSGKVGLWFLIIAGTGEALLGLYLGAHRRFGLRCSKADTPLWSRHGTHGQIARLIHLCINPKLLLLCNKSLNDNSRSV